MVKRQVSDYVQYRIVANKVVDSFLKAVRLDTTPPLPEITFVIFWSILVTDWPAYGANGKQNLTVC